MKLKKIKKISGIGRGACLALLLLSAGCGSPQEPPEKLWLHRVNSLEKLRELGDKYDNFEVDVTVRPGGRLDVTHDADTTFRLWLDDYFPYLQNGREMWIDIKNLDRDNADPVRQRLDSLRVRYGVRKERLIVESSDWEALRSFTRDGWYTSYYIRFPEPTALSDAEREAVLDSLRFITDSGAVRALSFPGSWYFTIRQNLDRDIDLLTWKHHTTWGELIASPFGRLMGRDPQLKVILVKEKGRYHR